ncbi:MAG: hypothetical protein U5K71_03760 [Gracilimonas sp.]|nr:hypothetical protein [Gracilimonas sp.]
MKQFTSHIDFSLTKKRFKMMLKEFSPIRSGSKGMLLIPVLLIATLMFCTTQKETDYSDLIPKKTYSVPELHYDGNRSEELGIPLTMGAQFTSSGELFTGTKKIYNTDNDSLRMELFFKDGINTGSVEYKDGNVWRSKRGRYLDNYHFKEMYKNETLIYKDVPPSETEDGLGHIRQWHENGQLSFESFYYGPIGDRLDQGLMTEYDEEGNVIMQERYEDGELVETIK